MSEWSVDLPYGIHPIAVVARSAEDPHDQLQQASSLFEYVLRTIDEERHPHLYAKSIDERTIEEKKEHFVSNVYKRNEDLIIEQEKRRVFFALGVRNDLIHADTKRARASRTRTFPSPGQVRAAIQIFLDATHELCRQLPSERADVVEGTTPWWHAHRDLLITVGVIGGILLFVGFLVMSISSQ